MSAHQLITGFTWAVFVTLFVATALEAIRRPSRTHVNIALLFAAPTLVVLVALAASGGLLADGWLYTGLLAGFQLAIPYLTLRLARDFATVRAWVAQVALLAFLALAVASFLPAAGGMWLYPLQLVYYVGVQIYSASAFAREAGRAVGITRRRLASAAVGALLLGLAPLAVAMRPTGEVWLTIYELTNLAAGIAYFFGFAPPGSIRRSWQEPELRAFLRATAGLAHLDAEGAALRALERAAAAALGAPGAQVGLWDEARSALRFEVEDGLLPAGAIELARRVFLAQRAEGTSGPGRRPLALLAGPGPSGVTLAAPLTAGQRRFGVLVVHTPREALFARDDLEALELLAVHAAGVLESRALIAAMARVQARAEATRLKEDFLSAAAHDLKTPLTTLVAQAQFLARRLERRPAEPPDPRSVALIVQSAERLRDLVYTLLDAARAERGQLLGRRANLDLVELVHRVAGSYHSELHPCTVTAEGAVICNGDGERLGQLLGFLLDNAVKYSPDGGAITVDVRRAGDEALISVSDNGIGIDPRDLPHLFDRFHRGANVDDRSFAGMGLSLALCRVIAEQHGGRIWAESRLGAGSSFTVVLPLVEEGAGDEGVARADHDR